MEATWPKRLAIAAAAIAVVGLVAAWLVPLVPVWPCTLLEHFRVQYTVTGIAIVAAAGALRTRGWFDVASIALILHLWWIAPDLCSEPQAGPADGVRVRVLVRRGRRARPHDGAAARGDG